MNFKMFENEGRFLNISSGDNNLLNLKNDSLLDYLFIRNELVEYFNIALTKTLVYFCVVLYNRQVLSSASPTRNSSHVIASNKEIHEVSDRHNNTATVVIGIMCGLFVFVLLAFGLRNPRGRMTLKRIGRRVLCCAGSREPSYRFIRVSF